MQNIDVLPRHLGEFEQIVLLAVLRLSENAYGVPVRREIEKRTQRSLTVGALYRTLDRLEDKGYVVPGSPIRFPSAADAPSVISAWNRWAFARCDKAARSWPPCGKVWSCRKRGMGPKFSGFLALLFRLRFGRSADFALGDLIEESNSGARSRRWLWRQALSMFGLEQAGRAIRIPIGRTQ